MSGRPTDAEYAAAASKIARERYAKAHAAWVAAGSKSAWQQAAEASPELFEEAAQSEPA